MTKSTIDACSACGLCNSVDPVIGVIKKETVGTRFKALLAKEGKPSTAFYLATDTGAQEVVCPSNIDLAEAFRLARERCVKAGLTTDANERMRANFARTGTPYENLAPENFREKNVW
jgi:Fe-S oxidoreductase